MDSSKNKIVGNNGAYLIPLATDDEFLIEKTPTYSQQFGSSREHGLTKAIASQMQKLMPNVKLFMFVTDPVDRIYSHIKESFRKIEPKQIRFLIVFPVMLLINYQQHYVSRRYLR